MKIYHFFALYRNSKVLKDFKMTLRLNITNYVQNSDCFQTYMIFLKKSGEEQECC